MTSGTAIKLANLKIHQEAQRNPACHGMGTTVISVLFLAWLVVIVVGREIAVTGLRAIASGEGIIVSAEELGKYKMIFQMFALHGLLLHYTYLGIDFHLAGMYFLWASTVVSLWSGSVYTARVTREIQAAHRVESGAA